MERERERKRARRILESNGAAVTQASPQVFGQPLRAAEPQVWPALRVLAEQGGAI